MIDISNEPIPRVEVYLWWCGDEICDCTQPTADVIVPKIYPNIAREVIWQGTFHSESGGRLEPEEYEQREKELKAAAKFFNVTLEDDYGSKPIRLDMCPACGSNAWWLSNTHKCSSKDENGNWIQTEPKESIAAAIKMLIEQV
jgi:hypothetical protein